MISTYFKENIKLLFRNEFLLSYYIRDIERLYKMSPEELKKRNEKKFIDIFRLAYNKSKFYHTLYSEKGIDINDIRSLEDIKYLPIITKEMIRTAPENLLTCSKFLLIKNHTSGTTGTPLTVYESLPSIWRERAYYKVYRKKCGEDFNSVTVSLRGNLDKNSTHLYVHLTKKLLLSSYNINQKFIKLYHSKIIKYKPQVIEGYPSALYNLAVLLKENNLECHIPLCFTSSETLFDYQRDFISNFFKTKIFDHYGTTERTISLRNCISSTDYFESPGYSINEYHDNCVITTSLINNAFPLIRYQVPDIINVKKDDSGKERIVSIEGRTNQYLIGKDGTKYSGGLTYIIKALNGVKHVQLIQKKIGKVEIHIVCDDLNNINIHNMYNYLDKRIGLNNMDFEIKQIKEEDVIYTKRNKFNFIISML